jgi:hypothetical protein
MPKTNWGSAAGGAASGAISGASIGSIVPGVGTAIGAGVGGLVGGIAGLFGNKKKKAKKRSTLDPQQQALYNDYISSIRGEGPMKDLYNFNAQGYNDVFDKTIGRQANRNFQENTIPSITGQFRSKGLQNSSYVGESLSRAGRDVQENLDALRSQNIFQGQQQANQNKQNAINNTLGMQTFSYDKPGAQAPSTIDQILGSVGPAAGEWFADYLKKGNTSATAPAPSPVI